MTTPAMRIAVCVTVISQKRSAIFEQLQDDGVGLEDVLSLIFWQTFEINALVTDGSQTLQTLFLRRQKIVRAMPRRGMHDPAALIERHVVRQNSRHFDRQKRMLEFHALEVPPFPMGTHPQL